MAGLIHQGKFIDLIQQIVLKTLEKLGLFQDEWHFGKVESQNANGTLNLYIDGSDYVTREIPCNPNTSFSVNDEVFVHFINRNSYDMFVPYKRQIIS